MREIRVFIVFGYFSDMRLKQSENDLQKNFFFLYEEHPYNTRISMYRGQNVQSLYHGRIYRLKSFKKEVKA